MNRLARAILIAAAFASMTTAAYAADAVAPRRVVVVHVNGTPDETAALESTMRELLGNLQLTMATGSAPASSVLETVTIDMTAVGAKVVVKSASGSTVIDRLVRGESPSIQREQIGHAVRGAAEAELLVDADRVAGRAPAVVDPPPPPLPAPEPTPPPPAPLVVEVRPPAAETPIAPPPSDKGAAFGLDVSTCAGGGGFANDASVVARVGGSIAVASRRGLRPSIALTALYAFPFETGDEVLSARTRLFSLRLMPGISVWRAGWFGLETSAGGGLDVVTVDPASGRLLEDDLRSSTTRVNPIVSAAITGRATVAPDVSITLTAMLDVDLTSRSYVFEVGPSRSEVFSPWSVRPMLLAGVSFAAFGGGR